MRPNSRVFNIYNIVENHKPFSFRSPRTIRFFLPVQLSSDILSTGGWNDYYLLSWKTEAHETDFNQLGGIFDLQITTLGYKKFLEILLTLNINKHASFYIMSNIVFLRIRYSIEKKFDSTLTDHWLPMCVKKLSRLH